MCARSIYAPLLPLVSSSRTASRPNSGVYTFRFFDIVCSFESGHEDKQDHVRYHSRWGQRPSVSYA